MNYNTYIIYYKSASGNVFKYITQGLTKYEAIGRLKEFTRGLTFWKSKNLGVCNIRNI